MSNRKRHKSSSKNNQVTEITDFKIPTKKVSLDFVDKKNISLVISENTENSKQPTDDIRYISKREISTPIALNPKIKNKRKKPQTIDIVQNYEENIEQIFKPEFLKEQAEKNKQKPNFERLNLKSLLNEKNIKLKYDYSIFKTIWNILDQEVIWLGLAIIFFLGAVLFYFQGIQPVLLNNYYQSSKNQVESLSNKFENQTNGYVNTRNLVTSKLLYNPLNTCNENELYQTFNEDIEIINRLEVATFPDNNLQKVNNNSVFIDDSMSKIYSTLYDSYKEKLSLYEPDFQKMKDYLKFVEYRNNWINTCRNLENPSLSIVEKKATCTTFTSDTETFIKNNLESVLISDGIATSLEESINICKNTNNFNDFEKKWFDKFAIITSIEAKWSVSDQEIELNLKEFTDMQTTKTIERLDNLYKERRSFLGMWFFPRIEL